MLGHQCCSNARHCRQPIWSWETTHKNSSICLLNALTHLANVPVEHIPDFWSGGSVNWFCCVFLHHSTLLMSHHLLGKCFTFRWWRRTPALFISLCLYLLFFVISFIRSRKTRCPKSGTKFIFYDTVFLEHLGRCFWNFYSALCFRSYRVWELNWVSVVFCDRALPCKLSFAQ
jgi:hypothetical protein